MQHQRLRVPDREVMVGSVPFATVGNDFSSDQEARRKDALISDFLLYFPATRQLKSSYLETRISLHETGANLDFWLYEQRQMSLPLSRIVGKKRGIVTNDGFTNEVAMVKNDIACAPQRINFAISPTRSGDEVRNPNPEGAELRRLRARAGKRRPIVLPGESARSDRLAHATPKLLPHAVLAVVKARVASLVRAGVILEPWGLVDPVATVLVGLTLTKSVFMTRPCGTSAKQTTDAMLTAMDKGEYVTVKVAVCFDFAGGLPDSLEFVKLVEPDSV